MSLWLCDGNLACPSSGEGVSGAVLCAGLEGGGVSGVARDAGFYRQARLVTHIDDATIAALTDFYAEFLPPGSRVLDLMSSWVSHLPEEEYGRVAGLGMNAEELAANPSAHVIASFTT